MYSPRGYSPLDITGTDTGDGTIATCLPWFGRGDTTSGQEELDRDQQRERGPGQTP